MPTTSTNSFTGTWSPALDNTQTKTYTFVPTSGQCATNATMTITVNAKTTPSFTQVAAICTGTTLSALPTTSTNSFTGTWSPALDNTQTKTYTFVPTSGQCATNATMTITVNAKTTPLFTQVPSVCSGTTLSALPTTSTNSFTGTWSPAINNIQTTTYTFTPSQGQCANTATLTIQIDSIPNSGILSINGIVCLGKLATIKSSVGGGVWNSNDNSIATVDGNGLITFVSEGTTNITYTRTKNTCTSTISKAITIGKCLNIKELQENDITLYPNPTLDYLNLQLENNVFVKYDIVDPAGNILFSNQIINKNNVIGVTELASGIYFIRLSDREDNVRNIQFVKN